MRKLWSESGTGTDFGDRVWYQCQSLVPVLVTEPGTGTGLHWWFRYRCEIQFRSGHNFYQVHSGVVFLKP